MLPGLLAMSLTATSTQVEFWNDAVPDAVRNAPELEAEDLRVKAKRVRSTSAGSLPEPMLELGIQNDGFEELMIGHMDSSFVSFMIAATFPWPGKRALRESMARLESAAPLTARRRAELGVSADLARAYIRVFEARGKLDALELLRKEWAALQRLSGVSPLESAQLDALSIDLELGRVAQRQEALRTEEQQALVALEGRGLSASMNVRLGELDLPELPPWNESKHEARNRTPELSLAASSVQAAAEAVELARLAALPDFTVRTAFMYRGSLPPMWGLSVAAPLPVWYDSNQGPRLEADELEWQAARRAKTALEATVDRLTLERQTSYEGARRQMAIIRGQILPRAQALAATALTRYASGMVPLATVVAANVAMLEARQSLVTAVADGLRLFVSIQESPLEASNMPRTAEARAPSMAGGME